MKAAIFVKPGTISVVEAPMPRIEQPTDAIIRIVRSCVCGSDLWWFRGISQRQENSFIGHEAIGVIEEVGSEVTAFKPGDFVIAPFTHGCGYCAACKAGFDGNCMNQEPGGNGGYQGEYLRFTNAHWALVKVPGSPQDYDDQMLSSLLTLSDVMATGYHAAASAEVAAGDTVVVMGDGAVGLCAVIAAKMLGAERIIAMSRHEDRQQLAREFGATDIVAERDDAAVKQVMDLTHGDGVDAVMECVGTDQAVVTALQLGRPGSIVGRVGIPQTPHTDTNKLFWRNIGLRGGIASATTYDRGSLLDAVLSGSIEPGKVFTRQFDLDHIQDAYEAMDQRKAIKSMLLVGQN